jgi:hypothetical protein
LPLLRPGQAFQARHGVVFIRLTDDLPEPLFNDGTQKATGVVCGNAERMSNGSKEVNSIGGGRFEIAVLDGLLTEGLATAVQTEIVRLRGRFKTLIVSKNQA